MGTLACADLHLMQRLLDILAKCEHKVIVSKGNQGEQLRMPSNAWGENFLPQNRVLPLVDLLIGHGGNNTFVEALYHGLPMLLNPFFGDQPDNAQRAKDLGLGDRFDAYHCKANCLLETIDRLLNDKSILSKTKSIGQKLQSRSSVRQAVDAFEQFVERASLT